MFKNRLIVVSFIMVSGILLSTQAFGQWATQTIMLQPGWNAIFLEVQPEPNDCESVFQGIAVESAWLWNRQFTSVQFIQDATTLMPEQPEWLKYFPLKTHINNLYTVQGGRAYLIKLGGTVSVNWEVKGRPVTKDLDWLSDSFNLVGFYINPDAPPTFQSFLASSPAHVGSPIYRLTASGQWQIISNPEAENIEHGRAYWVFCEGQSQYNGPLIVKVEQGGMVNFGRVLTEQNIRVNNSGLSLRQVTITKIPSEPPPNSSLPLLAGEVLLSYWDVNTLNWVEINGPIQMTVEPGEEVAVRIAVRRKDMGAAVEGALFQNLFEVIDESGSHVLIPVIAEGLSRQTQSAATPGLLDNGTDIIHHRAGLWVGTAVINKVNFPSDPTSPMVPTPTASEFQMRIIIHVNSIGQSRLLKEVTLMWQEGTTIPDPNDPGKLITDQPGRFVLVTDENLIPQLSGAAIRDGEPVGRRISTAAFAFSEPQLMSTVSGDFGEGGGVVEGTGINIDYNDKVNPFKHKYHPDHDNLDYDFVAVHPEGRESYSIERDVRLEFAESDPDDLDIPGWGDNQVGGIYREWLRGVHKDELRVEGTFRLLHVSRVPELNDGL